MEELVCMQTITFDASHRYSNMIKHSNNYICACMHDFITGGMIWWFVVWSYLPTHRGRKRNASFLGLALWLILHERGVHNFGTFLYFRFLRVSRHLLRNIWLSNSLTGYLIHWLSHKSSRLCMQIFAPHHPRFLINTQKNSTMPLSHARLLGRYCNYTMGMRHKLTICFFSFVSCLHVRRKFKK